jgi:hypothetical protein
MKVPTIQRIPIRKSAFVKSAPNSNNSDQNANFFSEDPSNPMPEFDNSSELQTHKMNIYDESLTISDHHLSRQKGNQVRMGVGRRMARIWQICIRCRNSRFGDIMERLTEKHSKKNEPWISYGDLGKGASTRAEIIYSGHRKPKS